MFRSKFVGCYFFAAYIFIFSIFRDIYFVEALHAQTKLSLVEYPRLNSAVLGLAYVLYVFGAVLVVTSSWSLGILGTYNGDYFGLLMTERLTNFPFSRFENPMYVGSTSLFLARALHELSPTGVLLSVWVWVCYSVGCMFEEPFTAYIYNQAAYTEEYNRDRDHVVHARRHLYRRLPEGDPEMWSEADVLDWLENVAEMPSLVSVFKRHDINGAVLFRLTLDMLANDLGVESLGMRFRILDAINMTREAHKQALKDNENNEWISERKKIEDKFIMTLDQKLLSPVRRRVEKARSMAAKVRTKGRTLLGKDSSSDNSSDESTQPANGGQAVVVLQDAPRGRARSRSRSTTGRKKASPSKSPSRKSSGSTRKTPVRRATRATRSSLA
eukprot:TRINITY_DN1539_c0_g2_i3.p1 TRINITY_DN1539_c0_g2~~TRINITY_DN1539_c0_g2_i3.p1  ORF type:complete len:385 (+),score=109.06 TRINITY_DN1539_c0_g2_i3:789-1943(+)